MDSAPLSPNSSRVQSLLQSMVAQEQRPSTVFLEGFAHDDRQGAYGELCGLLRAAGKDVLLLSGADWAPVELSGAVVCWWPGKGLAYMVSPAGRVVNWRKANSLGSCDKLRDCVLHTYAVTLLNERWLRSIQAHCSRI